MDQQSVEVREGYKKYKVHAAYVEGYDRGLNWPDAWEGHPEPGGPWFGGREFEQLRDENKAWREGWREGHADKLATAK